MAHFSPRTRNGHRVYVAGMAASSIASKRYALSVCDDCGNEVAWAQSSRTGKWYPCETAEYLTDGGHPRHRAMPYKPHRCDEEMARREVALRGLQYASARDSLYASHPVSTMDAAADLDAFMAATADYSEKLEALKDEYGMPREGTQ